MKNFSYYITITEVSSNIFYFSNQTESKKPTPDFSRQFRSWLIFTFFKLFIFIYLYLLITWFFYFFTNYYFFIWMFFFSLSRTRDNILTAHFHLQLYFQFYFFRLFLFYSRNFFSRKFLINIEHVIGTCLDFIVLVNW